MTKNAKENSFTTKGTRPVELQPGIPRGKFTKGEIVHHGDTEYAEFGEKKGLTTKGTRPVELQPGIPRGKFTKGLANGDFTKTTVSKASAAVSSTDASFPRKRKSRLFPPDF